MNKKLMFSVLFFILFMPLALAICDPGYYAFNDTCIACSPGTYNPASGSTTCMSCPAGTYTVNSGSTSCYACPQGYTIDATRTFCVACPAGTSSTFGGTCTACNSGYYSVSGGTCTACSSSCSTCSATTGNCLTCGDGLWLSSGSCVTSCGIMVKDYATGPTKKCIAQCPLGQYASADQVCQTLTCNGVESTNPLVCSSHGTCIAPGNCLCQSGWAGVACSTPVCVSSTEVCNGFDDDCDGSVDENLNAPLTPNQMGVCAGAKMVCSGTSGWINSYTSIVGYEQVETSCDNKDNDCDGSVDENGVCLPTCTPTTEVCNGLDDDCDGTVDENVCLPSCTPTTEVCNGLDDDCDGSVDEGLNAPLTPNQMGVCAGGKKVCSGTSGWVNSYTSIVGYEQVETSCDNKDNDCDGIVDENLGSIPTSCGIGACYSTGARICSGGSIVDTCVSGTPTPESCDDIDNDCNGLVDDIATTITYCGVGVCSANTGLLSCSFGQWYDSCDPLANAAAEKCDYLDNDCDGNVDESFATLGSYCSVGIGSCASTGVYSCTANGFGVTCNAIAGTPVTEICSNTLDDDCDGLVDEGCEYQWSGFFQPIDNLPVLNQVSAGRAIPIKFSLNGDRGLNIFAEGYPKSGVVACDLTSSVDLVETTNTVGGSSLSYDPVTKQYTYVWKTHKSWVGCRQLVLKLNDGTVHYANFKFVK